MQNTKVRLSLIGIILLITFTFTQSVFACSPIENLHIFCNGEKLTFAIFREEDLAEALDSCQPLQPISDKLAQILLEANALDSLTIISAEYSKRTQENLIHAQLKFNNCYSPVIEHVDEWIIGYSERNPYCVKGIAFCTMYTVSPGRKIAFELQNGQFLNPLVLFALSVASISAGTLFAKSSFYSHKFTKIQEFTIFRKKRITIISILGIMSVLFICGVPAAFLFAFPYLNRLFFPSIPEYILRVGLLLFLVTFVFTQNLLHVKSSKRLKDTQPSSES